MSCEQRRDNILLYAANALDAAERDELRRHLASGCPRCGGALAEAQSLLALVPRALATTVPPPGARERLMQRIAAGARGSSPRASPRPLRRIGLGWIAFSALGSAAIAAAVTIAIMWAPFNMGRQVTGSKDLQMVALAPTAPGPGARGRIFWDREKNDWRLYVFDLAPPPPGRTYELWFITPDQRKIAAGTFDVASGGRGSLEVPLPPNLGPVAAAAITDEPAGGTQQPTGEIRLLGKVE